MSLRIRLTVLMVAMSVIPMVFVAFVDIRISGVVAVVTVLIVSTMAFASASAIARPIRSMIDATRKITEGKLPPELLENPSADEIGQLSIAMKVMAAKLKIANELKSENERYAKDAEIAARNVLEDLQIEKDILAVNKAKDDAMLASIGDALVATDVKGRITLVNAEFEKLMGWKLDEIKGEQYIDVIPMIDDKGKVVPQGDRAVVQILKGNTGIVHTTNTSYITKDKKLIPVDVTTTPISLADQTVGVVQVFRDVSKERAIDKAKTEFVSLASHQLRTPLTAISWYTEMILHGDVGRVMPKQKTYLERIYQGDLRMIDLVNTLLDVSRFELGTLQFSLVDTDIGILLRETIDELQSEIKTKHLTMVEHVDAHLPLLKTDPKMMKIILENLFTNAILYTPEKGKIECSISLEGKKNVSIIISDTGFGIPNYQQHMIFTKLFRADNVREKNIDGTGLGLYLVKSIVENLGGSIRFESEIDKGTTFFVTLPLEAKIKK